MASQDEALKMIWERPKTSYHAHFDCFSGAAGDMMLAACLDAAGDANENGRAKLLKHVSHCLQEGMHDLKGEFSLSTQQVWRGMGSITACYVKVESKYNHEAAPFPKRDDSATMKDDNHSHEHDHEHQHQHQHQHEHSHDNKPNEDPPHDHSHDHRKEELPKEHDSTHSHGHFRAQESVDNASSHDHSHAHDSSSSNSRGPLRNLPQIRTMLQTASTEYIPKWVQDTAIAAFTELAHAEAKTHGAASSDAVHFHEVGAVDSIVDTVGTLLALYALNVISVSCSRLPLGEGTVWTDHGLLPVPAPATLRLMVGMPTCPGPKGTTGELVTPTAAALLRVLVRLNTAATIEGRPPNFTIRSIGIGAGTKDFVKHPNVLRLVLGDSIVESVKK